MVKLVPALLRLWTCLLRPQGGSRLPLALLLHVVVVPTVPLPEGPPSQAGVRLRDVVVAEVRVIVIYSQSLQDASAG